ncbi:MAG: HIT family protein [Candidatus Magasanikbacteria bacterium CG10_big_fil_rev_8_21_14_0_10_40_10]|uniref:HIT family protein n=1 Tax=Candidatus Magasanikbacteria bacterium CG10_big_fil_rev_8_21_14_0_10_40_10 TaxID=1974648 RepID=A0A2M6W4Q2_9BACT|nr:MAG: HIT family protein [Candidatus Magasanikbacteria bacterium CG10_big_fil_rev_8_21_14_0_10_40_10]
MDCLFCKVAKGQIPSYKVYEDENTLAFLDIFPHASGHTVVISKQHYESLSDLPAEKWAQISLAIKMTWDKLQKALKPDGCNIGINNGSIAGQVVKHVHWHILPRYQDDKGGSIHSIIKNPGKLDVKQVAKLME